MSGTPVVLAFLYRLAGLALLGLLGVILVGPVVAVVGVLASFALIGFIFWVPIRLFVLRKPIDWAHARERTWRCGSMVAAGCGQIGGLFRGAEPLLARSRAAGLFVVVMFREMICGALVGAMLGLIPATQGSFDAWGLVLGLSLGAAVGALVALAVSGRRPTEADFVVRRVD